MSMFRKYNLHILNLLKDNEVFSYVYLNELESRINAGLISTFEMKSIHNDLFKIETNEDLIGFKKWQRKEKIKSLKQL